MSSPTPQDQHGLAAAPAVAGYRPDIDGLRAIAVASVVLFHAFPGLLPGGFAGVDVFYVISGFLIGGILVDARHEGTFTYRDFYARRIRRLFPALVVVLAAVLVAGYFLMFPSEYRLLGKHVVAGAGFASNLVFLRESGYFDTASALKPLLHLWSLGVEEQFYILCPLLLAWFLRSRLTLPVTLALFALASFVLGLHWLDIAPKKAFFHPAARFWELFAGVTLAALQREATANPRAWTVAWIPAARALPADTYAVTGLALLAAGFILLREGTGFPGWWALLPVSGSVLLIGPAAGSNVSRWLLANRVAVFVGLISYPLYLWHWPLLSFARIHFAGAEPALAWRLALVVLAVLLSWATWRWIEKPLRHPRAGFNATRALSIAMIAVTIAGVGVMASDGISSRYPPAIRAIAGYSFDSKEAARAGKCFLNPEQTQQDFAAECEAPAQQGTHPLVVLWGDSHAGHLYPGLAQVAPRAPAFALVQLTASGCPPVPGMAIDNRPACRAINDDIVERVRRLHPDVVVLGGFWAQYTGGGGWNRIDPAALRGTIAALRAMGVPRVVVVGEVPIWTEAQPSVILRLWNEQHLVVDRTAFHLSVASLADDTRMRAEIAGTGALYVSPVDLFCRDGECMTFSGPDRTEPVAFDYGHLSRSASLLLAGRIRDAIFSQESPNHAP